MLHVLAGFLAGTLADYFIHRFVGHAASSETSRSPLMNRHQNLHHTVFNDRRGYAAARGEARRSQVHLQFFAVLVLAALAAAVAMGLQLTPWGWFGFEETLRIGGGLLLAIAAYDLLHWMHHSELPGWLAGAPIYKQLRAWHHRHHAETESRYSVVLPLWDFLFLTHRPLDLEAGKKKAEAEAKAAAAAPAPRTRSGQRRQTKSVQDMLESTLAEAEADLFEETADKTKKKPRERTGSRLAAKTPPSAGAAPATSPRPRPTTGAQAAIPAPGAEPAAGAAPETLKKPTTSPHAAKESADPAVAQRQRTSPNRAKLDDEAQAEGGAPAKKGAGQSPLKLMIQRQGPPKKS